MIRFGKKAKKLRWAGATVEMAVVMPLLLTVLLGIIEYGWVFSVKAGLAGAAREGARVAILPGSTDADIQNRIHDFLYQLPPDSYTITLTRATLDYPIETVQLTIPYARVSLFGGWFGARTGNLESKCSMRKEGS